MSASFFSDLIYTVPAVLIAIVLHEWAHGYLSYRLGDPSPKEEGRLSLNPLHHLDPIGTLCLLLFHFGWAKPVQVNPYYYKDKRMGMMLTALAGPLMNLLTAFIMIVFCVLMEKFIPFYTLYRNPILFYLFTLFMYTAIMCIGLGVFNLIPIPPLDGSKILLSILPEDTYFAMMRYEHYGSFLLILLLACGGTAFLSPITTSILNGMLKLVTTILL